MMEESNTLVVPLAILSLSFKFVNVDKMSIVVLNKLLMNQMG